jgi:UDP-2,3-diacylglucosamine pyrophosphatase LpxH
LGSKFCEREKFVRFLDGLPPDAELVLNGDTIDRWHKELPPADEAVLRRLGEESLRRRVVWVYGNHDDGYTLPDPGRIEFRPWHEIGKRLFVAHGFVFDNVMPRNRCFIAVFRLLHRLRIWLGAESVHVAFYAKKWKFLYGVLRRHVAGNAVEHAVENGFPAVTCGHTHFVEDVMVNGVRYINTGSWTEEPIVCLLVTDADMRLVKVE